MSEAVLTVEEARRTIAARNGALKAVLSVVDPPVVDATAPSDAPLRGVPFVLKDTWDTAGIRTTAGSYRHRARIPRRSAPVLDALLHAGAVLLGKSNVCDLAFSAESDNHLIGATKNPHDVTRTSGGSTGGGAAAVASGMATFDWGTDFGGSIRIPAAFCGVVGLRLSSASWPVNDEHFPRLAKLFWPFLGMGPLTRDVATARRVVNAVRSLRSPDAPTADIDADRVVVYEPDRLTRRSWPTFGDDLRSALTRIGVKHEEAQGLPAPFAAARVFDGYLCAHFPDFAGNEEMTIREGVKAALLGLASGGRLDKRLHPKGAVLFSLIALGHLTLFRNQAAATRALEETRASFRRVWERHRLLVMPTSTMPAPRHGRTAFDLRLLAFAKIGNLTDATALALPWGHFAGGMPRSLSILGPPGSEDAVMDLAARLEAVAPR